MATSAIGGSDQTLLRGPQSTRDVQIHITPLVAVQTATITAVPTKSPYPQLTITWDGAHSAVSPGQLVKIVNGATLRAYAIVRKAPTATILYISETTLGAPGYTQRIESAIQAGDTLTVYTHRPLWGLYSRIEAQVFYKQFDLAYVDQNENIPPVANAGSWQSAKITSGSASFTLPRFGTNTSFAMSGSISSRLWTLPAGVTLQSGYALTDAVIAVDAMPGAYLVSHAVTDSNGKSHTAYTWLFVSDGTTGTSLSERYAVQITSDSQDRLGRVMQLSITGSNLDSVLFPGAGILVKETADFNGSSLSDGVFVDTFIGYIAEIDYEYSDGRISSATITAESPLIYANRVPQPVQLITEVSNPAKWTECTSALSNPRGAVYYAAKWHTPALLDMHDFDAGGLTTPRRKDVEYNTKSLGEAVQIGASQFNARVGSASDGTTVLRNYPLHMNNTDRNNLAVVIGWQAQDFKLPLRYTRRIIQEYAEAATGAFAYNGSAVKGWYAKKRWYQGVGTATLPDFAVTMTDGVTRVKEVVGHFMAEQNTDLPEITLDLLRNQDVIDPAYLLWNRLTIESQYDPRGVGFSSERMLPTRIDRTWELTENGLYKRLSIGLQPETFGQPGEEIKFNTASSTANIEIVPYEPALDSFGAFAMALAHDDAGNLAITYNYSADSPDWIDLTFDFIGLVNDFCFDYNSGFFTSGGVATEPLGLYVVTADSGSLYVYWIDNLLDPNFFPSLLTSVTMADSTVTTEARIVCSETTPTLVLVCWKDAAGTGFIRSTDGGDTWSSAADVASSITDAPANDNAPIGVAVYGQVQLVTAPNASEEYGIYRATTAGGAFSALSGTPRSSTPQPMIQVGSADAYTTVPQTSDTIPALTWNAAGKIAYSSNILSASPTWADKAVPGSGTVAALCIDDQSDYMQGTGSALGVWVATTDYSGDDVILRVYHTSDITAITPSWPLSRTHVEDNTPEGAPLFWSHQSVRIFQRGSRIFVTTLHDSISWVGFPEWVYSLNGGSSWSWENLPLFGRYEVYGSVSWQGPAPIEDPSDLDHNGLVVGWRGSGTETKVAYEDTGIGYPNSGWDISVSFPAGHSTAYTYVRGGDGQLYINHHNAGGNRIYRYVLGGSFTEITPSSGGEFIGLLYHMDLARGNDDQLVVLGQRSDGKRPVLWTDNGGTSWSQGDLTHDYKFIHRPNDNLPLAITDTRLDSVDTGSVISRIGNLATAWGSIGTLKGVITANSSGGSTSTLRKITGYAGTPSWSDISPTTNAAPERPYDLILNRIDEDTLDTVASNGNWYQSSDGGNNWANQESSTTKRTFVSQGDAIMSAGTSAEVKLALDGSTFNTKTGNLAAIWGGSPGIIKRILAI